MIEFRALGTLELKDSDGRELRAILTRAKRLALLSYLAFARPRGFHRRDTLVALLWPELDHEHARGALRQALYYLREALGRDVVAARGDEEIGLDGERISCDAVSFENLAGQGAYAEALRLYRGDFLPGFHLAEASDFEQWLDGERERLRRKAAATAWRLAAEEETKGNAVGAAALARRAVEWLPYEETGIRRLIELLDRIGDRSAAMQVYEEFSRRVARDLELDVSAETRALVDAVRNAPTPAGTAMPKRHEREVAPQPVVPERIPPNARARRPIFGGIATLSLAALGTAWWLSTTGQALPPDDRVAVLPFEALTPDSARDPLGRIAADWISQQLASTGVIKVIPSLDVMQAVQDDSGEHRHPEQGEASRRLALALGAGTVIRGSYYRRGDTLTFQAELFDLKSGTIAGGLTAVTGSATDPRDIVARLAQQVTGLVATKLDLMLSPSILQPPTFDAYRLFVDGHREMWRNHWEGALDLFLQAAARDSTFSHALYLAAINAMNLNQWRTVDSLVQILSRKAKPLPPFERVQLEYLKARLRGDEDAALLAAREMAQLAPGTGNQYLAAFHALRTNRPREAANVLTSMDPDRGFLRGWFWYWYVRGQARHAIRDHQRELADARSALDRFPDLVFARALELRALAAQGKVSDILSRLNDTPAGSGSAARDEGSLLEIAGFELRAHGHSRIGADLLQRAVTSYELVLQNHPDDNTTRFSLARTLFALGRHDHALTLARQLRAGDADNVEHLGLLGTIQAARGVDEEARKMARQLDARTDPYLFGRRSYWLATMAAWSGDLERAVAALNHAFDEGLPFDHGMSVHGDAFLEPLRGRPAYERLVRARG